MKGLKRFWILLTIIHVLIIGVQSVRAQQTRNQKFSKNFSYTDAEDKLAKGILNLNYEIRQISGVTDIYVNIIVEWYDSQGRIIDNSLLPYLYLSIYDLTFEPENVLSCLSFAGNVNDFHFQDKLNLIFRSENDIPDEDLYINYGFRYALTIQDYENGNIEKIKIPGSSTGLVTKLFIPLQTVITEELIPDLDNKEITEDIGGEEEVVRDSANQTIPHEDILKPLRTQLKTYQNRLSALKNLKIFNTPASYINRYENNLNKISGDEPKGLQVIYDGLSEQMAHVNSILSRLRNLQLNTDSFIETLDEMQNRSIDVSIIKTAGNQLNIDAFALKAEYQTHRDDITHLLNNSKFENLRQEDISSSIIYSPDSLVNQFRIDNGLLNDYDEIFSKIGNDYDTLKIISENLDPADLSTLSLRYDRSDRIYKDFIFNHDSLHNSYISSELYIGAAQVLDSLHEEFKKQQNVVEQTRSYLQNIFMETGSVNQGLADSKNVFTWLYILSGIILIAFVYFFIRRIISGLREKKRGPEIGYESWTGGYDPFSLSERNSSKSVDLKLYYPLTWEDLNGGYIRFVFLSQDVINEIYNFSRNSISRKLVYEVGGYLFGHYERVGLNGIGCYNVFIDHFVPARALESSSHYQMDFGSEALEELERAIQSNQNMVCLGWFHTHPGHSPILSDNNRGIHKNHFSEKWQLAIVVDPSEEGCLTAVYSNNPDRDIIKTGSETEFFRWKDLVGWAEDPEKEKVSTFIPAITNEKTYYTTRLNDKWCDSVVSQVSVEKNCIIGIEKIIKKKDFRLLNSKMAGFFYGNVYEKEVNRNGKATKEYDVVIEEIIESGPGNVPLKTSGFHLMGWFGFDDCELFELIEPALKIQEREFKEKWQLAFLLNRTNNELRIFSRRKSLEMNNNVIETNELNLKEIIDWARAPERSK